MTKTFINQNKNKYILVLTTASYQPIANNPTSIVFLQGNFVNLNAQYKLNARNVQNEQAHVMPLDLQIFNGVKSGLQCVPFPPPLFVATFLFSFPKSNIA